MLALYTHSNDIIFWRIGYAKIVLGSTVTNWVVLSSHRVKQIHDITLHQSHCSPVALVQDLAAFM